MLRSPRCEGCHQFARLVVFLTPWGWWYQGKYWPLSLATCLWLAACPARQHICPFCLQLQKQTLFLSTADSILQHLGLMLPIKCCHGLSLLPALHSLLLLCLRKGHPLGLADWLGGTCCRDDQLVVQSLQWSLQPGDTCLRPGQQAAASLLILHHL